MPNTISLDTPLLAAFQDGLEEYQPIFRGEALAAECANHLVSVANVETLLSKGLRIRDLIANGNGRSILVTFDTGEQYLATGFAYGAGSDKAKVIALAKAASKWLGGSAEAWHTHLTFEEAHSVHYREPLRLYHDGLDHDGNDDYAPRLYEDGVAG